jgi:hypothetical protein
LKFEVAKMEKDHQQTPMSTKLTTMLMFLRDDHSDDISTSSMVRLTDIFHKLFYVKFHLHLNKYVNMCMYACIFTHIINAGLHKYLYSLCHILASFIDSEWWLRRKI